MLVRIEARPDDETDAAMDARDRTPPNVERLRAAAEARMQVSRAFGIKAEPTPRPSRNPLRFASHFFSPRSNGGEKPDFTRDHSPETLFWA